MVEILRVIHVLTAILMAWPAYALVAVNQRARLGPPVGDRVDTYLENIIKNRTIPCFVFQATALVSGVGLLLASGRGLGALVSEPVVAAKLLLLALIVGLLSYVHVGLQPRIDALFAEAGGAAAADVGARIAALRLRRKRIASVCLFVVLTVSVLGLQVWAPFRLWLTALLIVAVAGFTWRAYTSVTPYGWI